jgi:hypothetical protein
LAACAQFTPYLQGRLVTQNVKGRGEKKLTEGCLYKQLFFHRYNEHYGAEQIKGFHSLVRSIAVVTIVLIMLNCALAALICTKPKSICAM